MRVVRLGALRLVALTVAAYGVAAPSPVACAGPPERPAGTLQAPVLLSVEIVPEPAGGEDAAPSAECPKDEARCALDEAGQGTHAADEGDARRPAVHR